MSDDNIVVTKQPILNSTSTPLEGTYTNNASGINMSDTVKGINVWTIGKYLLILFIFAFLGFNIFTALGNATDNAQGILRPILASLGFGVGETIKQTVDISAKGTKTGIDVAKGTVDNAVTLLEKSVGVKDVKFNRIDKSISTENAITNAMKKQQKIPVPDDATSSTQKFQKGKSGYCYIGEDRGFRSCIKVGEGDTCMSGDIFPSNEICINPNLRE